MSDNLKVKATKAVDDSRMVGQAVYPGSKGAARNMHNIVATSIHQVKDASMAAQKVSDDAKTAAHKAVSDDAKVAVRDMHKDAGMRAQNVSGDAKSGVHKAVSYTKNAAHNAESELKKK